MPDGSFEFIPGCAWIDKSRFHDSVQRIDEIKVLNATPEQQAVLNAIIPAIRRMKTQVDTWIDAALDRAHHAVATEKGDQEIVNDFTQNMRLVILTIKKQVENLLDWATEIVQSLARESAESQIIAPSAKNNARS
jgi:CHASE3 domain sensor protein